jgi:bifunctional ADP-heptose synthase (sugar kinase/adenylyltransferase)
VQGRSTSSRELSPESLLRAIEEWRAAGLSWAVAAGSFDLIHAEHARRLAALRAEVDRLVCLVTEDAWTAEKLGDGHPVSPAADRARVVAALRVVDAVAIVGEEGVARLGGALATAAAWRDMDDAGLERWRRLRGERS